MNASFPTLRLRRLRQNPVIRDLVRETRLTISDLVMPLFIKGEKGNKVPISSMPGLFQIPLSCLEEEIDELVKLGISSIMLFGIPPQKDAFGSDAFCDNGIVQKAIAIVKKTAPHILIMSDICCCEYTEHGHCGFIDIAAGKKDVDNDKTLEILAKQAVSHAKAGADVVAPSGMIDGMVKTMRKALDDSGFSHIPILSYSVKYASSMYGPFRYAAEGAPSFGDRKTHQMDPSNALEAVREAQLDVEEGADMLMVKPAHTYLDVIYRVKQAYPYIPLAAYHVSGEYSMIKAAANNGWLDEKKVVSEILHSIRRAGADFIITYFAKDFARSR